MIIVRADGNARIGAGHIVRCLTIAESMARRIGHDKILFACADRESAAFAGEEGFRTVVLDTNPEKMETELMHWRELLSDAGHQTFLVDSYYATDDYLWALARYGRVAMMDDFGTHRFPARLVINGNANASRTDYEALYHESGVKLCIGSTYFALRQQFLGVPYTVQPAAKKILITTGGGDADNIAGEIYRKISNDALEIHVVVGTFSPHAAWWKKEASKQDNLFVHSDVKDMASLMCGCDVAITAGGGTVYELASLGVPFICFSYAPNQEALTEWIGREDKAGYAGAYHKDPEGTLEQIAATLRTFLGDAELRKMYSAREKELIDGRGAERVAEAILALA